MMVVGGTMVAALSRVPEAFTANDALLKEYVCF